MAPWFADWHRRLSTNKQLLYNERLHWNSASALAEIRPFFQLYLKSDHFFNSIWSPAPVKILSRFSDSAGYMLHCLIKRLNWYFWITVQNILKTIRRNRCRDRVAILLFVVFVNDVIVVSVTILSFQVLLVNVSQFFHCDIFTKLQIRLGLWPDMEKAVSVQR